MIGVDGLICNCKLQIENEMKQLIVESNTKYAHYVYICTGKENGNNILKSMNVTNCIWKSGCEKYSRKAQLIIK